MDTAVLDLDLWRPQGAIFNADHTRRYALWRVWDRAYTLLLFIGLNPSRAGDILNDPTILRVIEHGRRAGYGGIMAGNLYSFVTPYPKDLQRDEADELNEMYLQKMISLSGAQLCGWGSFKPVLARCDKTYAMLTNPVCLAVNKGGQPKHPLYVGYNVPMVRYSNARN